jgi:hypothetical protein
MVKVSAPMLMVNIRLAPVVFAPALKKKLKVPTPTTEELTVRPPEYVYEIPQSGGVAVTVKFPLPPLTARVAEGRDKL